ncbi:unnamed protein product [Soboliphyme baturini]|uniref:Secreted protein n=1 Tax=Soboliphyme baturini TaxID=241478 RepID=A0A183ILX9_9BILA|nr:unnamed protein product [Soboliphyme baturini]
MSSGYRSAAAVHLSIWPFDLWSFLGDCRKTANDGRWTVDVFSAPLHDLRHHPSSAVPPSRTEPGILMNETGLSSSLRPAADPLSSIITPFYSAILRRRLARMSAKP